MPWRCCVPGCKGYDEAKSMGVIFHGLPTRDLQRCRTWLRAINNPRLDENTPVSKYSGVRVCSLHFRPEDYEEDFRAKIMNSTPKPTLKSGAVPSVFPGTEHGEPGGEDTSPSPPKRARSQMAAEGSSSQSLPAAGSDKSCCIVVSLDPLDDGSFQSEPGFSSITSDESDEDVEKECTIVYNCNLMELFRRCQTCGQLITLKEVSHLGAQMTVKWSCHGGHSGLWKSSPQLKDTAP